MLDRDEMRRRLAAARVGRLATIDPAGRPHAVPICFVLLGVTVYSAVDGKPKTTQRLQRLANVAASPPATLLVDHYDDRDWTQLWWVRVRGAAREVADASERDAALAALRAKYPQYVAQPPAGPVLALDVDEWRGWSWASST